jgi:C-terminal processing protease CtpA/Prc
VIFAAAIHVGGEVTVYSESTIDVVRGGPAERAGVRDGDRIIRIARGRTRASSIEDEGVLALGRPGRAGRPLRALQGRAVRGSIAEGFN